ncbi:hypothetical protein Taro_024860 [Colocasia esculenta]|uniref:Uncharacterized protein n=1 Tax=Colocasia esculenta TaxID=4460 RepID=A0A843VAJ4_COLES|nr:hypothetical protein [Colocasia esculenta]
MSSKTLARAGASLLTRLLPAPRLTQSSANLAAKLSSNRPAPSFLTGFQVAPPAVRAGWDDLETMKLFASAEGMHFPCGLPSARFFWEDGEESLSDEPMLLLPKRTYQPSHVKRKRTHGYFARGVLNIV